MAKAGKKTKKDAGSPNAGDLVKVTSEGMDYEGILLPSPQNQDKFQVIKLSTGYNLGISKESVSKIEVLKHSSSELFGERKKESEEITGKEKQGCFISFLGCGGTIVNKIDYRTGAVYPSISPKELISGIPGASNFNIRPRTVITLASEDFTPGHWINIAKAVADEIKDGAEGVILTHGTDTMHYTSAALSFMLQNLSCPVTIVGSQRSSDRPSSDSEANFLSSLTASKEDISGVFICMHENLSDSSCLLHFGTKVRKMHTSRRDAFRSINSLPAARIFPYSQKFEKISEYLKPRGQLSNFKPDTRLNTNVAMLYVYPGIRPEMLSSLSKYDGVVVVGFGLGHLPVNVVNDKDSLSLLPALQELIDSDIPVVLSSQVIHGRVDMNVYSNQRILLDAGIIGNLCDMTPECAYVKLMHVLGKEKKMAKVKEMMETSLVGEIAGRSQIETY